MAWQNNWSWTIFGFGKKINWKPVAKSLWLTVPLFIGLSIIEPFLQKHFGALDLSSVEDVRGDIGNYAFLMFIVWCLLSLGKKLLFSRGECLGFLL